MAGQYNYFGLTYNDILSAYPGTALTDFDAGGPNGQVNIESEMQMQEARIIDLLSPRLLKLFNYVVLEEVIKTSYVGQTDFTFGMTPNVSGGTNFVYVMPDPNFVGNRMTLDIVSIHDFYGNENLTENNGIPDGYKVPFTYTPNGLGGVLTTPLSIGQVVYATYSVNVNTLNLPSLKFLLRNMVAANYGYRLYDSGDQRWGLVDKYIKDSDEGLAMVKVDGWLPSEIKKMTWYTSPFKMGGSSFVNARIRRG